MKGSVAFSLISLFSMAATAGSLTISGISSGGFMASQMATIYSDQYSGVATVAGGVFYCAENKYQENLQAYGSSSFFHFTLDGQGVMAQMGWAVSDKQGSPHDKMVVPLSSNPIYQSVGICMGQPEGAHQPDTLKDGVARPMNLDFLRDMEAQNLIAPTAHIARQRVLIYQGKNDAVVHAPMADKLQEFYSRLGVSPAALKVLVENGNHNFPTDRNDGIDCNDARFPFIASCKKDLAGNILQHLVGRHLIRSKFNIQHLRRIQQKDAPASIAKYGYIYATPYCLANPANCDLHVALHGCQMSDDYDENFQKLYQSKVQLTHILTLGALEMTARRPQMGGLSFARRSGYAEYAEDVSNHLMILFPQTQITTANYPANPNGCWDWFGWTGPEYATNRGSETAWLNKYINTVRTNPRSLFMKEVTEPL